MTLHQVCVLPDEDVSVVSEFPHVIACTLPKDFPKQDPTLATDKGTTSQDANFNEASHPAHIMTLEIDFSTHLELWSPELEKPTGDRSEIAVDMLHKALIREASKDTLIQNPQDLSITQKWTKRVKRITLKGIIQTAILTVVEVVFLALLVKISGKEETKRLEKTERGDDEVTLAEHWKLVGFKLPFSRSKDVKDS